MMKASRLLLALALVAPLAGGCKKDKPATTDTAGSGTAATGSGSDVAGSAAGSDMAGSGSAGAAAGSDTAGSAAAGSGSDAGSAGGDTLMSRKGGNCPTLVATSTTKVTVDDKKGTVTVAIAATDK